MNKGLSGLQDRVVFEALEPRLLLDGNVTAKVVNGDLRLTGDRHGNGILIERGGTTDTFIVTGQDGTAVNGGLQAVLTGVTDDIIVDLKGARNDIWLHDLTVPDSLKVKTGSGGDVITMDNVTVTGQFTMRTRARDDYVTITDLAVGATARITTGAGDDMVDIERSLFHDRLWAGFGSGADYLEILSSSFSNVLSISMGGQDDYATWMQCWSPLGGDIYGGKGDDTFRDQGGSTTSLPALYGFESIT